MTHFRVLQFFYLIGYFHYSCLLYCAGPLLSYFTVVYFCAGGAQHDTVAAVTHILFTITNPTTFLASFESQLWNTDSKSVNLDSTNEINGKMVNGRFCSSGTSVRGGNASTPDFTRSIVRSQIVGHGSSILSTTASKLVRTTADVTAAMEAYPLPSTSSLGGERRVEHSGSSVYKAFSQMLY